MVLEEATLKTAIVTGANGFIGHHFLKELSKEGYYVIAVVRNEQEKIDNISCLDNVQIVYCDMCEMRKLKDIVDKDVSQSTFYHLAWAGNSGAARGDYALQLDNAKYTVEAAKVASELGCNRFVVTGSVTQLMYRDYLRCDEVKPEIVTCYAVGKMAAEAMLKCVCTELNIELCWAYIANFYGADDTTNNFINFLIANYKKKATPELTPAEQLADFMYVTDVALALRLLGEKGTANTSYYIGYGEPKPLKTFIEIIHQKIAPEIESGIGRKPFSGMNIDFDKIDYKKFSRDTGFKPTITFDTGIEKVICARMKEEK